MSLSDANALLVPPVYARRFRSFLILLFEVAIYFWKVGQIRVETARSIWTRSSHAPPYLELTSADACSEDSWQCKQLLRWTQFVRMESAIQV